MVVASYLVHNDRNINDNIDKVSQCQTGYQCIRAIPHTLVLVNDPQQRCIPNHSNDENSTRYHRVNVFKSFSNLSLLGALDSLVGHQGLSGGEEDAGFDPWESGKVVSQVTPIGSISVRAVTEDKSWNQQQQGNSQTQGFHPEVPKKEQIQWDRVFSVFQQDTSHFLTCREKQQATTK